ncbi:hypothetical protein SOVF_009750 isoform B [Spinacia oleracea]|nr:hypothetical protein SOVF_009750 isoform B [Spinacia oleracea]
MYHKLDSRDWKNVRAPAKKKFPMLQQKNSGDTANRGISCLHISPWGIADKWKLHNISDQTHSPRNRNRD